MSGVGDLDQPAGAVTYAMQALGLEPSRYSTKGFEDVLPFEVDPQLTFEEFQRTWPSLIADRSRARLTTHKRGNA